MRVSNDRIVGLCIQLTRDRVPFCVTYADDYAYVRDYEPGDRQDVCPPVSGGEREDRRDAARSSARPEAVGPAAVSEHTLADDSRKPTARGSR